MSESTEKLSAFSNVKNQFYATLIANCIVISHGCTVGWTSVALPLLLSEETPLVTGPLSNQQLSWVASMSSFSAIIGTFIYGTLSATIGCKRTMAFMAFPTIIFWTLIYFGNSFSHVLCARFAAGLTGGGFQTGVALYISEISNDDVRGRLGSVIPMARNMGVLLTFTAGAFVQYNYIPSVFVLFPIVYLILMLFLPNTPQYYLRRQQDRKAEEAIKYYKRCKGKDDREKSLITNELERLKWVEEERKKSSKNELHLLCNGMAFKGIFTSIAVSWFLQSTGCLLVTSYASLMFEKAGTSIGVNPSSITVACAQIIGGLLSTRMGDTFGRKTTLAISLIGSALGLFTFSAYMYLCHHGYNLSNFLWLPVLCLSLIIFISSAGIVALANTIALENFPSNIRTAGMVLFSVVMNTIQFSGDKLFPVLLEMIYLHGILLLLGANCCVGLVFVAFMKETKGESLDSINKKTIHVIQEQSNYI